MKIKEKLRKRKQFVHEDFKRKNDFCFMLRLSSIAKHVSRQLEASNTAAPPPITTTFCPRLIRLKKKWEKL